MHPATHLLDPINVQYMRLVVALVLGGLIGTERAILAKQAAGTRTFGLVSMGACLFILIGATIDTSYLGLVNIEPLHLAAAIITGIGFIGGGLIVLRHEALHGVTTAAGLWIAAGVGMACGFGLVPIAVFSTLLTLIMFTGMWYIEDRFKNWFNDRSSEAEPMHRH